jgi:glycosyltransferase involved in cell wall biosynthesis
MDAVCRAGRERSSGGANSGHHPSDIDTLAGGLMEGLGASGDATRPTAAPLGHVAGRPRVSVIVPCFRQAEYLAEAVESVVAQTYTEWELIIVDDGSPDDAAQVAEELMQRFSDRAITLVRQPNRGVVAARNEGIRRAASGYILPLDADDRLEPEMLAAGVAELIADPDIAIVYTDQIRFGDEDRVVRLPEFDADLLCEANQLPYCSIFRREVWEAVGGYSPAMADGYEDWDFWIAAAEHGFVARRIPRPLAWYRVKADSRDIRASKQRDELRARIAANHPASYTLARRFRRRMRLVPQTVRRRAGRARRALVGPRP